MSATFSSCYQRQSGYLREVILEPSPQQASSTEQAHQAMDAFLAGVEQKALVLARISLRHVDDAHDVVQDTMIRLVRKYADRPRDEWKPLFYRILRNRIIDQQRRHNVRQRIMAWLPATDGAPDPIAEAPGVSSDQPDRQLELSQSMTNLGAAVQALPARQQQAFLLRTIEGMSVAQTAIAMGCSGGSVKTHYSRAIHSLRATLGDEWGGGSA